MVTPERVLELDRHPGKQTDKKGGLDKVIKMAYFFFTLPTGDKSQVVFCLPPAGPLLIEWLSKFKAPPRTLHTTVVG